MANISERIKRLEDTITSACERVDRERREVKLVIVTKSVDIKSIREVLSFGYADFGENRVQRLKKVSSEVADFLENADPDSSVPDKVNWHMIGHLQRNKVKQVLPITFLIHSVDTLRLAEEINQSSGRLGLCPKILLQINCSNEPQKYGAPVGAAIHLAEQIGTLPNVQLTGLMTMAPLTRDKDVIRGCFERMRELFIEIKDSRVVGRQFSELSMGMSSDYQIAVEEGATILRIGSAIFAG